MKINEKNLSSFASSRTPIDKEGFLFKRGDNSKGFHRRWFILKGNLLFYAEKKTDKDPIGVIILEGCTVELDENEEAYSFKLVFHGQGLRHYVFSADSQESMESWMKAVSCASYDYMKLLVAELQRKLDEITESERQSKLFNNPQHKLEGKENGNAMLQECLSKGQRFNPFDGMPSSSTFIELPSPPPTKPPSSDNDILMSVNVRSQPNHNFSFHELHEYYGFTFRKLFKEWNKEGQVNGEMKAGDQLPRKL